MTLPSNARIWKDLRLDTAKKHTWAFYYYLKRCGDTVHIVKRTPVSIDIVVIPNGGGHRGRTGEETSNVELV